MAVDLQVVFPQEQIRLDRIQFTSPGPLNLPRSLDIVGQDFRAVDEVLVNGIESPDVVILSKTRLLAQLPEALASAPTITDVSVLSRRLTVTPSSLLRFRISNTPGRVRGTLRLMQRFLKILMTTPGRDIFSRRVGGGLLRSIGETYGSSEGSNIVSNAIIAVDNTARQLMAVQGRDPSTPPEERLLRAQVTSARFNRELGALLVTVELTSQAGRAAFANLEL